jgi:hypothetical protein
MLNHTGLDKDKDAHSLQALAQALASTLMSTANQAQEDVLPMVVEVVHAQVTPKLMDADTSSQVKVMTVKTPMLITMLDSPVYKLSEEELEADVSLVLFLLAQAALLLVSASSIVAVDQALILSSSSK